MRDTLDLQPAPPTPAPQPASPAIPITARWRRSVPVAAGLVAAWLVPLGAQLLHVDWILPPLVLLGVASLLRTRGSLLDRLLLALLLLLAATAAGGLVLTVWPWHLQPVATAGTALSALVVLAAVLRRRPSLPLRLPGADRVILGLTALATLSVLWPFRGLDRAGRLGIQAAGGDLASHFSIVDGIRHFGGYLFLHSRAETTASVWDGLRSYPQGLHMVGALLTNFADSTDGAPSTLPGLDTFVWFDPATYILFCLCVLWAMRRLAGPGVRALAFLPVGALVTAYLLWSDSILMMWMGYWPEIAGLAQFAVLVAVLARPLSRIREQVMVVAALLVSICFTYYLMLPVAAVLTVLWLLWHRRTVLGARWYTLAVLIVAAGFAAVMPVESLTAVSASDRLLTGGSIPVPEARMLTTFGLLAAAGYALTWSRRSPAWWLGMLAVPFSLGLVGAIGLYQEHGQGQVGYYYYKAVHVALLAFLLGLAPLSRLISPYLTRTGRVPARKRARMVAASLALTLAAIAASAPFVPSFGRSYLERELAWDWVGKAAVRVVEQVPAQPDTVTVIWGGRPYAYGAQTSHWANVLWRTNGVSWRGQLWVAYQPTTGALPVAEIEKFVRQSAPYRVRFVTDNQALVASIQALRGQHPELPLEVVDIPLPA
jgi:hypothetical protein